MRRRRSVRASLPSLPQDTYRVSVARFPEHGTPREWRIVGTFLRDQSLRYAIISFAGPAATRVFLLTTGFLTGLAAIVWPLVRQVFTDHFSFLTLLPIAGVPLCLELMFPLREVFRELRDRLYFGILLKPVDLGLERTVPQAGTAMRYEVHLSAKRRVNLRIIQVRLVFWESWVGRSRLRVLRIPRHIVEKSGHDLTLHEIGPISMQKGQQAVIRGSIRIPQNRPSEHHRGTHKHMSYVNLTITLESEASRFGGRLRGNCPQLITFPWI